MEDWKVVKNLNQKHISSKKAPPDLARLAASKDQASISEVRYAHDPVPKLPQYIRDLPSGFPRTICKQNTVLLQNAVKLFPREAHLPFRCIDAVYENRYWRASLDASLKVLELIANDRSSSDIEVDNGVTLARLAQKELRPGTEDRFNRATTYMYPFGTKERTELLAAMMVMQFLFDDKCEKTSNQTLQPFVDDFVKRLNKESTQPEDSELQRHISDILRGFRAADQATGSGGGQEVINTMRKAFQRRRPDGEFSTVREYLDFRVDNVGAQFVLASVKFSICSNVDLYNPRLATFLNLAKDHLSIVNDLASFDKEQRAFKEGSDKEIINIVDVVQKLMSLPNDDDAKVMTYTYQLQTEVHMRDELEKLASRDELNESQWQYLHAVFVCCAGNAFYSMISSRYGGEAARIKKPESKKRKATSELLNPRATPQDSGIAWMRGKSEVT